MERMWNNKPQYPQPQATTYAERLTKSEPPSPAKSCVAKMVRPSRASSFHAIHKVPLGDSPYDKAKQMQLMNKDPEKAIALFWAAINAGDKVDSALKDMAIVMKQQNRSEEAIEAIISLRNRCSTHAQESLDNILLDLYKRCGRLEDQIKLLKHKLNLIHQGLAFNGKRTKTARSQGKKFRVTIEHEVTRLLGNLGWAYIQQSNYVAAEAVYRKALSIEPDNNKMCNLAICLIHQGRVAEAKSILQSVMPASSTGPRGTDSHLRSYERAHEMLREVEAKAMNYDSLRENSLIECLQPSMGQSWQYPWEHNEPNHSEHEMPNFDLGEWEMTTFHATSGFALSQQEFLLACDKSFQSSLFDNSWKEDKVEEDGFGDENININTISSVSASSQDRAAFGFSQNTQTQQSNVEVLSQMLEKVCLKENANVKHSAFLPSNSSDTAQSSLNSAAAPFISKYANQCDRKSTFSNGLGSMTGFEERVPLMFDRINEQRKKPFEEMILGPIGDGFTRNTSKSENINPVHQKKVLGPIGSGSTRNTVKSENTNPVHQKKVLGPIGSGSIRNTVKSENTNPVHQKKVLGPIGSGSTRNTTKSENTNPGDQRTFLGQSSHNQIKPTTKQFLSFEYMGSGRESMGSGFDLPPLPTKKTMAMTSSKISMQEKNRAADPRDRLFGFDLSPLPTKKTMAMTSSKNAMALPMQEKNAVADPCDSLRYIQLPNTLEFEQAMISCISEAADSDQAPPPEKQNLQGRHPVFLGRSCHNL